MCKVEGCVGRVVSNGLCDKHRQRLARHGTLENTRPPKWGQKEKHQLYDSWYSLKRNNKLEEVWKDFWTFVKDVGERPLNYRLYSKDKNKLYGPDNFEWLPIVHSISDYEDRKEYMRAYRKANPEIHKNLELKRKFGITLNQYNKLKESQNSVCAICGKPETIFDSKQQKLRELSVDHCHTTGKIRGLLCSHCNHAIGKFNDDVDLLQKAINYLTSSATCDSITTED